MSISILKDDNGEGLTASMGGLRAVYAASGQKEVTTGAAIAELDISALNVTANQSTAKELVLRVVTLTNPCYFSLGAAGTPPADTTTMDVIPPNTEVFVKARATDVSAYHKQITAAATLHISVRV